MCSSSWLSSFWACSAAVRSRSIRYQFVFRRLPDGEEVARGAIAAVCATVEKASGKLVAMPIPEAIRAQITVAPQISP